MRYVCVILAFLGGTPLAAGQAQQPENIARGAGYSLEPAPNYAHCTEGGDAQQLTDGAYVAGHFWTQPGTVGWSGVKPVLITIDLGEVKPISGVSFNTAAGVAGVEWPESIFVLVAGEDKRFHEACNLVASSAEYGTPPEDAYAVHRFQTDTLHTHGRYVTFAIMGEPFIFVDEIEVYAGQAAWLADAYADAGFADVQAYLESQRVRECVERRIRRDVKTVRELLDPATLGEEVFKTLNAELDAIEAELKHLPIVTDGNFRAVLPLNELHRRVYRMQAARWRALGRPSTIVWQSPLWDMMDPFADPPEQAETKLEIAMMANEYRAAAFNISNAGEADAQCSMRAVGLPVDPNSDFLKVQEAVWTDTAGTRPVAAALVDAQCDGDTYLIHVPTGMTRQVWCTFHPGSFEPATREGHFEITGGDTTFTAPISVRVYPFEFPEKTTLLCGGWDYTNADAMYGVTPENRAAFIRTLRDHFVNAPWATNAAIPRGAYDDAGNMITPPDTANFDEWLRRWPDAAQYYVFASVKSNFDRWDTAAPQFVPAVQAWIRFWADYVKGKGIEPERLCLLVFDEPREPEHDTLILAWTRAIHSAGTRVRVWEDPIHADMTQANAEMLASCDILCPNRVSFLAADEAYRQVFSTLRDKGITLEFYSCSGPVRLLDPYRYFRIQPWECLRYGAVASHFWAFGDNAGQSSWNEYAAPRTMYTPLFLDAHSVTTGKHLEAMREGIEDFEYFVMLRKAVEEAESRGVDAAARESARALLKDGPMQVCDSVPQKNHTWANEDIDRSRADQVRIHVLDMLAALDSRTVQIE